MDLDEGDTQYPDPTAHAFSHPYPEEYQPQPFVTSSASHGFDDGNWPPGPASVAHEGYIPREQAGSDSDEDPSDDYRVLSAEFGLGSVLNDVNGIYDEMDLDSDGNGEDVLIDHQSLMPRDGLPPSVLNLQQDDPEVDPDFETSAGEEDSADDTEDGLSDSPPPKASTRGQARGRGRGGRGARRGWKWALKGTEHDPNLDKPGGGRRGRPPGSKNRGSQVPRGEGRRKGKNRGHGPAEPSAEFKQLQQAATSAFMNQDLETAAEYARNAIKSNPEIFAAHNLLSEILLAQGKREDALTILLAGAHTHRDPALWHSVAELTLDLAGEERSQTALESAVYCYTWAIKLDSQDYDARREKLNLLLEIYSSFNHEPSMARAKAECKMMIKQRPFDMDILRHYTELCIPSSNASDIAKVKEAFDRALALYTKGTTLGPEGSDQWAHLSAYLDLVYSVDGASQAVMHLKRLARWLLGRKDDTYWDDVTADDREYDNEESPRRVEVEQYTAQSTHDKRKYGNGLPIDIRIKLGMFRMRMGPEYLDEAKKHFAYLLDSGLSATEFLDLYRDVADALYETADKSAAVKYYEPLSDIPEASDEVYYRRLADCYTSTDRSADAEDCYKILVEADAKDWESRVALAKMYEDQDRESEALPLIDEVIAMGRRDTLRKARVKIPASAALRSARAKPAKEQAAAEPPSPSALPTPSSEQDEENSSMNEEGRPLKSTKKKVVLKKPQTLRKAREPRRLALVKKPPAPTLRQQTWRETGRMVQSNFEILESCQEDLENGDEDALEMWMDTAQRLIRAFQSEKAFYAENKLKFEGYGKKSGTLLRDLEIMRSRLGNIDEEVERSTSPMNGDVPEDYHDIKFSVWLDLFCQYALNLAKDGQTEACHETLASAYAANVFHQSRRSSHLIHSAWTACALILNDEDKLTTISRWFVLQEPHASAPYEFYTAVSRLYVGETNWFNSGPSQKFLLRQIKAQDFAMLDEKTRKKYSFTSQERNSYKGREQRGQQVIDELDYGLLILYGHVMTAAQSWHSALNYYFRAYALVPDNAMLNLCIGISYIQGAMKRQAENRHWQIMQGFAFVNNYHHLRTQAEEATAIDHQEADFNVARAWHLLGIAHHAVRGYERCLALSEQVRSEARGRFADGKGEREGFDDFTQEAAFALVNILTINGNYKAARKVTERYLVI